MNESTEGEGIAKQSVRRAVAQLGSALDWGSRGRGFESRRPDQDAPEHQVGESGSQDRSSSSRLRILSTASIPCRAPLWARQRSGPAQAGLPNVLSWITGSRRAEGFQAGLGAQGRVVLGHKSCDPSHRPLRPSSRFFDILAREQFSPPHDAALRRLSSGSALLSEMSPCERS